MSPAVPTAAPGPQTNIALASAPEHVFLRHTDGSGRTVNLEATSGARPARTAWYRDNFPIGDRAIASGLYMRSLSRREAVALMAVVVLEQLMSERCYDEAIAVAGAILKHDPRAGQVMVLQGSAYGFLLQAEFLDRYRSPFLIPAPLRARFMMLARLNHGIIEAAEALGWQPMEEQPGKAGKSTKRRYEDVHGCSSVARAPLGPIPAHRTRSTSYAFLWPFPAGRPDRLWRRHEHVRLRGRGSGERAGPERIVELPGKCHEDMSASTKGRRQ